MSIFGKILGLAGTAAGTVVGGPAGGAVGGSLGGALGGALGGVVQNKAGESQEEAMRRKQAEEMRRRLLAAQSGVPGSPTQLFHSQNPDVLGSLIRGPGGS